MPSVQKIIMKNAKRVNLVYLAETYNSLSGFPLDIQEKETKLFLDGRKGEPFVIFNEGLTVEKDLTKRPKFMELYNMLNKEYKKLKRKNKNKTGKKRVPQKYCLVIHNPRILGENRDFASMLVGKYKICILTNGIDPYQPNTELSSFPEAHQSEEQLLIQNYYLGVIPSLFAGTYEYLKDIISIIFYIEKGQFIFHADVRLENIRFFLNDEKYSKCDSFRVTKGFLTDIYRFEAPDNTKLFQHKDLILNELSEILK